jgi:Xaa-Pro dipeptidase
VHGRRLLLDITRRSSADRPTADRHLELEHRAQAAAFAAAAPGAPCEAVDAAARMITDAGFGPDYKVPNPPHRARHRPRHPRVMNFVRGNKIAALQPGMCFSDEPMMTITGSWDRLRIALHHRERPEILQPAEPRPSQAVRMTGS